MARYKRPNKQQPSCKVPLPLLFSGLFAATLWLWIPNHSKSDASDRVNDVLRTPVNLSTPPIENHSLTAIPPIISHSFEGLEVLLSPFLVPSDTIREVILICPQTILSDARRVLKKIMSYSDIVGHPDLSLIPYTSSSFYNNTITSAVSRVRTEWVLVLDNHGLQGLSNGQQAYLLSPLSISLPVGPNGFLRFPADSSRVLAISDFEPAEYLIPPFVVPTHLFPRTFSHLTDSDPWLAFGLHVGKIHFEGIGGLVLPSDISNINCCERNSHLPSLEITQIEHYLTGISSADNNGRTHKRPASGSGRFVLVVPHLEDLHAFMPVICRLQSVGHIVSVLLYQALSSDTMHCSSEGCTLQCSTLPHTAPTFLNWLDSLDASPDVVFALEIQDFLSVTFTMVLLHEPYRKTTLIRLPRADIPYSDWIGSLSLLELRS
jgi:hypothetical protein